MIGSARTPRVARKCSSGMVRVSAPKPPGGATRRHGNADLRSAPRPGRAAKGESPGARMARPCTPRNCAVILGPVRVMADSSTTPRSVGNPGRSPATATGKDPHPGETPMIGSARTPRVARKCSSGMVRVSAPKPPGGATRRHGNADLRSAPRPGRAAKGESPGARMARPCTPRNCAVILGPVRVMADSSTTPFARLRRAVPTGGRRSLTGGAIRMAIVPAGPALTHQLTPATALTSA